jgi:hypothetical protein
MGPFVRLATTWIRVTLGALDESGREVCPRRCSSEALATVEALQAHARSRA